MNKYITISRLKHAHVTEGMGKSMKTIMQVFLCLSRFPVSFFKNILLVKFLSSPKLSKTQPTGLFTNIYTK
ncbi:hypothetical protein Hanom_Chr11g01036221 [Helianthus anomalus]